MNTSTTTRTVVCPSCQTKLRTASSADKQVRCPKCQVPFRPTTPQPVAATKTACGSCQTKVKGVKPGAKFKCPKCGSIERAAPVGKPPVSPTNSKPTKAPAPKPAVKQASAKKPAPKPMKPMAKVETKAAPDATDDEIESPPETRWKSEPMPVAPPRPAPAKASTSTSSSRSKRRDDDDDEESSWRISGKLLATLIILVSIGAIAGAWSLFGGDSGPARGAISGEVTIDGALVEFGTIHFGPIDTKAPAVQAVPIKNGKYQIARDNGPSIGMCKVDIRVQKKTGRKNTFMGVSEDEIVEGAADRFNTKSELTFDVKAGVNTKNFEVSAR